MALWLNLSRTKKIFCLNSFSQRSKVVSGVKIRIFFKMWGIMQVVAQINFIKHSALYKAHKLDQIQFSGWCKFILMEKQLERMLVLSRHESRNFYLGLDLHPLLGLIWILHLLLLSSFPFTTFVSRRCVISHFVVIPYPVLLCGLHKTFFLLFS